MSQKGVILPLQWLKTTLIILAGLVWFNQSKAQDPGNKWAENFDIVIANTRPLGLPRGHRLPLYLWPALEPGSLTDQQAEQLVKSLNERGIAPFRGLEEKR